MAGYVCWSLVPGSKEAATDKPRPLCSNVAVGHFCRRSYIERKAGVASKSSGQFSQRWGQVQPVRPNGECGKKLKKVKRGKVKKRRVIMALIFVRWLTQLPRLVGRHEARKEKTKK